MVLVICLIGLVAGSSFGIFFSGEDNGTGQTIRTAIAQINQEYQDRLEEIKDSHTFDTLEISGSQAVWKEVLAIYAIKTTTDPEGQEVASMDNKKLGLLAEIFWEMNQLDAIVETHTDSTESETSVETEVTVLVITVTHKTALEMAQVLNFDSNQKEQLQELLSPEFDDLWNELLYGITLPRVIGGKQHFLPEVVLVFQVFVPHGAGVAKDFFFNVTPDPLRVDTDKIVPQGVVPQLQDVQAAEDCKQSEHSRQLLCALSKHLGHAVSEVLQGLGDGRRKKGCPEAQHAHQKGGL